MIGEKDIKKLADLAKIELSREEIKNYKKDIQEILDYFEALKKVNTEGIIPLVHPLEQINDFREDKAQEVISEESKSIIEQSPNRKGDYVKVESVFGNYES